MRRVLAASLLLLGCALALPALVFLAGQPARAAARARELHAPASDARSCKPLAPVALQLQQTGADGDVVTLAFAVTPHADAGALAWSLALPPGAELLDGAASGALPAGSAGTGPLTARVRLPAADGLQLALRVDAELSPEAGSPGERLASRRVLTWGRPATTGRQLVRVDGAERQAVTPARHREGR